MTDLHARLVAAVTARRELAQAATPGPWARGGDHELTSTGEHYPMNSIGNWDGEYERCVTFSGTGVGQQATIDARFIVANDPARILRDTEAHLKILDEHRLDGGKCRVCCSVAVMEVFWDGEEETVEWNRADLPWPCPTINLLAGIYPEVTEQ